MLQLCYNHTIRYALYKITSWGYVRNFHLSRTGTRYGVSSPIWNLRSINSSQQSSDMNFTLNLPYTIDESTSVGQYWLQHSCCVVLKQSILILAGSVYLVILCQITQHDQHSTFVFPNHSPKVINSRFHWCLSGNECLSMLVSLLSEASFNVLIALQYLIH